MRVKKLVLRNFRNIEESEFEPDSRINFLLGKNGQGKTSYLEALSILATLRSFRTSKLEQCIQTEALECCLSGVIHTDDVDNLGTWETELKFEIKNGKKIASINDRVYKSASGYLAQRFKNSAYGFHTIIFNPSDHELIRGEPKLRRDYLNRVISSQSPDYLTLLKRYQRVFEQRNALLREDPPLQEDSFDSYTEQLCELGARLCLERLIWLQKLEKKWINAGNKIVKNLPKLKLVYASKYLAKQFGSHSNFIHLDGNSFPGQNRTESLEIINAAFHSRLKELRRAELEARTTLVGPHRDEWLMLVEQDPLKGRASQGEVRSALLALKLAEIELYQEQTGLRPVLLLDDFSSELDRDRRNDLLRFLLDAEHQVFVTSTEDLPFVANRLWVSEGRLELCGSQAESDNCRRDAEYQLHR